MAEQPQRVFAIVSLLVAAALLVVGGVWAVRSIMRVPLQSGAAPGAAVKPQTLDEVLTAAREYMNQDKASSAEVILTAAVAQYPDSQAIRLLYGECLLQQERYADALEQYEQGIMIGPDHSEYRFAAGTIAAKAGRTEVAETHYLTAQSMDRSNPKFPLYLAQVQRKLGKIDDARANLVVAVKLDPQLAIGWASLSAIALDENALPIALQHIQRARELEPERIDWRLLEAKILRRDNQPQAAMAVLEAIPEAERDANVAVLQEMGMCLGMMNKAEEAAALYIKAVGANPDDPELCYQAAIWLERTGQNSRAATYAQHAVAKGHAEAQKLLARVEE